MGVIMKFHYVTSLQKFCSKRVCSGLDPPPPARIRLRLTSIIVYINILNAVESNCRDGPVGYKTSLWNDIFHRHLCYVHVYWHTNFCCLSICSGSKSSFSMNWTSYHQISRQLAKKYWQFLNSLMIISVVYDSNKVFNKILQRSFLI